LRADSGGATVDYDGAILTDIDGDLDTVSIGWAHARVLVYEDRAITKPGS